MTAMVDGFLLKALHTFQVRTLRSLGFGTRVALTNKSHESEGYVTDYAIDVTVYGADQQVEAVMRDVARLERGATILLDCAQWEANATDDRVMIFHLIPERFAADRTAESLVSVPKQEIWALFTAQDHYVEYYREDGFSSGVLYQSGAFNYEKFSKERSTLIQAPKICLSSTVTTYLSLMHTSFAPGYENVANLKYFIADMNAQIVAHGSYQLRPFETLLLNFSDVLKEAGMDGPLRASNLTFYTLNAICDNASLLPLILNFDTRTSAISVEHSLPPMYYGQTLFGASRAQTIKELLAQPVFRSMS